MKQSSFMMKVIMSALLAGVLIYFGIYLFRSYQGGVTTVRAYSQTVHVGVSASGTLVREESVLTHSAASGKVRDTFEPWEIHIYSDSPEYPQPPKKLSAEEERLLDEYMHLRTSRMRNFKSNAYWIWFIHCPPAT